MSNKSILMILDGWGIGDGSKSDVIASGETPYMDSLLANYPNSTLLCAGEDVGLPAGQMGNSEVGHLNIGAGRVIFQDLVRINNDIKNNSISQNQVICDAYEYAKKNDKQVHFVGLIGDGGVHSLSSHLFKLCDITKDYGLEKVFIHALTDGRDTDPKSALGYMNELADHLKTSNGKIATVTGRYYTMDRDTRWDRVKVGYDAIVSGVGEKSKDVLASIEESYKNDVTDEFIKPIIAVDENDQPLTTINEGDVVFCFNYRTDRLRELTIALSQKDMPEHGMKTIPLHYLTMTRYDETFKGTHTVYDKANIVNTIGELVSKAEKKQIRIAETEKFAHVTFFFSGGREKPFNGEKRILIPSPKVATYDLQPEMSAYLVKDALVPEIEKQEAEFICVNFANGDMVGHTGIYEAILKAVNTVDNCVKDVVEAAKTNGYDVIIIADHGNADFAVNSNASPNTAHTTNPVPCVLVSDKFEKIENGKLADVAPTLLKVMGMDIPEDMTGNSLV